MQRSVNPSSQVSSRPLVGADEPRKPLVLVVDPDASARSVLEVVLVRDGFDVWSTGSGAQGLSLIKTRAPDVIVLETDLGPEDGFSFVSQVRGDPKTANVPVLLLARRDDENVANLAEVVGVDDFVQKPAFARDVSALVRLELAKSRAGAGQEIVFQAGQLAPAHLLRALLSCPRSGRLSLAEGRGRIEFHQGSVVDARFGKVWGLDALVRSIVLTAGEWSLVLEPVDQGNVFHCSLKELVQVVLPRVHAWEQVLLRSVPLDSRLAVDFFRLSKSLATMPDDVNRIVQLFDGQRTVRQVLLDSPIDHSMTLEVATRLYLMGIVLPVKDDLSKPLEKRSAPRLFEPLPTEMPQSPVSSSSEDDDGGDWFQVSTPVTFDEAPSAPVDENDGGWKAASLGESPELALLAPEVAKQIEAFNIRIEVEPREVIKPAPRPVPKVTAAVPTVAALADEPLAPVSRKFDRQARIITPTLTPAVAEPVQQSTESLEATFFASADGTATVLEVKTRATTSAMVIAPLMAAAPIALDDDDDLAVLRGSKNLPLALFAGTGIAVLLLAIAFEWAMKPPTPAPAIVIEAPVVAPVVVAPVLPDIEEPEFIEDDVPTTVIDVSGPLRDAKTQYERGYYAQAVSTLEQVIADEPNSVQAWLLLGLARYDANNAKGAREAAEKVLVLEPKNAGVQMLIATLSFESGNKTEAKNALNKYLALDPNGTSAEEAKALLLR